jgi:hypothetical protein
VSDGYLGAEDKLILAYRYSSIPSGQFTEEIKDTISTKHAELERDITTVYKQRAVLEDRLKDLNLSSDEEAAEGEGKVEALGQLNEQFTGLRASQDLLKKLLSKFVVQNSGFQAQTINGGVTEISFGRGGIVWGDGNSGFQARTINGGDIVWGDGNLGFQAGTINGGVSRLTFGGK